MLGFEKDFEFYHHIDNGGVRVSIEDRGYHRGIYLTLRAEYLGYPAVGIEFPLTSNLNSSWLRKVGQLFFSAADAMDKIDWEARYNI